MGMNDFFRKGKEEPLQPEEPKTIEEQKEELVIHVVQPGESLSKISREHYGDPMKWKVIYDANAAKISNPDLIHPGDEFVIPKLTES